MQKYKIGQLSKSMGVSSHLLKHYEKFDLVYPAKDDSTNYRYYDISQCARIIASKKFRNMGFSLKETANLINGCSIDEIHEMLAVQIDNLDEQLKQLESQKYFAKTYYEQAIEVEKKLDQWFIVPVDSFYYLEQTNNKELIESAEIRSTEVSLLDYVPIVKSMLRIEADSFTFGESIYHWGIGYWKSDEHLLPISDAISEELNCMESGRTFCTYVKVAIPFMDNNELIRKINEKYQEFAKDKKLTREIICIKIKQGFEDEKEYEYFAAYILLD